MPKIKDMQSLSSNLGAKFHSAKIGQKLLSSFSAVVLNHIRDKLLYTLWQFVVCLPIINANAISIVDSRLALVCILFLNCFSFPCKLSRRLLAERWGMPLF